MEKPKKLIRSKVAAILPAKEIVIITDKAELNNLYSLKIQEEVAEIKSSFYADVEEFADLLQVVICFAEQNGFMLEELIQVGLNKRTKKGVFSNQVLTNLNPNNPSNALYFNKRYYPAAVLPKESEDKDGYSDIVMMYEVNSETGAVTDMVSGFYNFIADVWVSSGGVPFELFCWSHIDTPPDDVLNSNWPLIQVLIA